MTYHQKIQEMSVDDMTVLLYNISKYTVAGQSMIDIHLDDVSHEMPNKKGAIKDFLESEAPEVYLTKETKTADEIVIRNGGNAAVIPGMEATEKGEENNEQN